MLPWLVIESIQVGDGAEDGTMVEPHSEARRHCFVLHVAPELVPNYRAAHAEVWPEMRQALSECGWHNYSIFVRDDGLVVGYVETDDLEAAVARMSAYPVNDRWQAQMAKLFVGLDTAPDQAMVPIPEAFHLD